MSTQQLRRCATLPMMSRPAQLQGYGQLMVDVPVDASYPTIKEVSRLQIVQGSDD
jgi:hypothetical protein